MSFHSSSSSSLTYKDLLEQQGYIVFPKCIQPSLLSRYLDNEHGTIDYTGVKQFIDSKLLSQLNHRMKWQSQYVKFRLSNNNNTDAAAFHRDVICQSKEFAKRPSPMFTCVMYLNDDTMEIVKGSHKKSSYSYLEAISMFKKENIARLKVQPGDIILFHANILHRGVFETKTTRRTILQVFEIFPSLESFNKYKDTILHVTATENALTNSLVANISRQNYVKDVLNYASYLNAATGYGQLPGFIVGKYLFLSSEGHTGRLTIKVHEKQKENKYIPIIETHTLNPIYKPLFDFICFNRQFLLYTYFTKKMVDVSLGIGLGLLPSPF